MFAGMAGRAVIALSPPVSCCNIASPTNAQKVCRATGSRDWQ